MVIENLPVIKETIWSRRSFSLFLDNWRSTFSFLISLSILHMSSSLEGLRPPKRPEPPEAAEDLPLREASLGAPPALLTWLDLEERLEAVAEAAEFLSEDP